MSGSLDELLASARPMSIDVQGTQMRDFMLARIGNDIERFVSYQVGAREKTLARDAKERMEKAQEQALGEWRRADTFDDKLREIRDLVMAAPDDALAQQILEVVDRDIEAMIEAKWPSPKKKKSDDEPVPAA